MPSDSWIEKIRLEKQPRSPRGLVEDCFVICISTPGICERLGIRRRVTQLRPMVFRYWFECPLCARRSFKLYLPLGATVFGCRTCHHLTYASSLKRNPDGSPRRRANSKPSVPIRDEGLLMTGSTYGVRIRSPERAAASSYVTRRWGVEFPMCSSGAPGA